MIDAVGHLEVVGGRVSSASIRELQGQARQHEIGLTLADWLGPVAEAAGDSANGALIDAAASAGSGLAAIATVAPGFTGPGAVRRLAAAGAVGFRLRLDHVASPVGGMARALHLAETRRILEDVAATGLPLLVTLTRGSQARAIRDATSAARPVVILTGLRFLPGLDSLDAIRSAAHLHVDTSRLALLGGIEAIVDEIGHERLLFGSDSPTRSIASPLTAVTAAHISADAKRAILGINAGRLFGRPGPAFTLPLPGLPAGAIDVHTHFGVLPLRAVQPRASALRDTLRQFGITANVASSSRAIASSGGRGNTTAVRAADPGDGQFCYLVADPTEPDAIIRDLRRWGGAAGVVGIKVHAEYTKVTTADPRMRSLFRILAAYGRPVLIHNDGPNWATALRAIALEHSRLPIVVAHAGLGAPDPTAARLVAGLGNVYLELSSSFADRRVVADLVRAVPRERLLFGTDAPGLNPAWVMGTYLDAGIAASDKAVFSSTARRLFGLS